MGVATDDGTALPSSDMVAGLVADIAEINSMREHYASLEQNMDVDIAPMPTIVAYLTYPNFYRIKKWNSSNWYAIAIANLADELK